MKGAKVEENFFQVYLLLVWKGVTVNASTTEAMNTILSRNENLFDLD